jgi:hypothetical protein
MQIEEAIAGAFRLLMRSQIAWNGEIDLVPSKFWGAPHPRKAVVAGGIPGLSLLG